MTSPTKSRGARVVGRISRILYRVLLLAYPSAFRAAYGDEAAQVFADACSDSWTERGARAVLRRFGRAVIDVPRHGAAERSARPRVRRQGAAPSRVAAELWSDVRYAARSIRRRPALAAGVIITLALGIGSNTAMFSVVNATLLRPLPYRDADRVVYLQTRAPEDDYPIDPSMEELERWAPFLTSVERMEARSPKPVLLTGEEGATRVTMLEVSAGYLRAVGSRRIAGRELNPDDGRSDAAPVVVISERLWRSRYGARGDIIGRAIEIDSTPRLVVGVTTDIMSDVPGLRFSLFGPLPTTGAAARETHALGVSWLKPGVTIDAARAELQSVSAVFDARGRRVTGTFEAPSNVFWNVSEFRDPQLALMAGVSLLLLIACINVATLLLGAGQRRAQELAVRRALGATRFRLARLLMVESVLLALAGGAPGLLLASWVVQVCAVMDPGVQLQTQLEAIHLDGLVCGYALAIAMLTAAICGTVPALQASAAAPRTSLFESGRTASPRRRWAHVTIAVEVALSLVLLIAAGLVGRAFLEMRLADPGFPADRILGVKVALPGPRYETPRSRDAFFDAVLARAERLPGVMAVGLGYGAMPPSDFLVMGTLQTADSRQPADDVQITVSFVSPGHFELMGIPLLAGGGFVRREPTESAAEKPVVISSSLQRRFWPDRNPIGEAFRLTDDRGGRTYRIVGVAEDVRGRGLISLACVECQWQMYLPLPASRLFTEVLLRLAPGAPPPVAALRATIREIDPNVPADESLETAAASLHGFLALPRFRAALFGGFAALAVTLVAFGLLAVVFNTVSQRTREIGIRLALGAQPVQVGREILAQGLHPTAVGLVAGLLLAWVLTRTMRSFLHGISPDDGAVYAGSAALLAAVAIAAILGPVLHAARVDPLDVLRNE